MDWDALIGRLVHPTQVAIIEAMEWIDRPLSPVELARVFEREVPLSSVAYHVRRLAELGVVVNTGMRRVRGAREHFYRLDL
jgi:predicted transcriptional regulator